MIIELTPYNAYTNDNRANPPPPPITPSEAPALYLVNRQASTVCEVLKHHEKYRSWFIESNVQSG